MKIIAIGAIPMRAKALFLSIPVILAGCALPLPDKPVRPEPYDLGPALAAPAASPAGAPLALDSVASAAAIDSTSVIYRLLYAGSGQQPRPYAHARWTMSPPQLVTQRLREALAATRPVLDTGTGLAALEMRAELDDFTHVFSSPGASEGVVRLRVTVTAPGARQDRLLGQRTFAARHAAPTPDAAGGVGALRAATDEVVRQVVDWVASLPAPR